MMFPPPMLKSLPPFAALIWTLPEASAPNSTAPTMVTVPLDVTSIPSPDVVVLNLNPPTESEPLFCTVMQAADVVEIRTLDGVDVSPTIETLPEPTNGPLTRTLPVYVPDATWIVTL